MQFIPTSIPGCYEIRPKIFFDCRGRLVKIFHEDDFAELKLETHFAEECFSTSKKNVLRGMHFQLPPHAHVKLVYCVDGEVLDVLVDLRIGSPAFGKAYTFNLSSEKANVLYIPAGVAHGFYVLTTMATMLYKTSTVHSPEHDVGILWSSFDVWGIKEPILSERDKKHPHFKDFTSFFEM